MSPDPISPDPNAEAYAADTPRDMTASVLSRLADADVLDRVSYAFIIVDRDWRIVYANREACRINAKPLEEFVGKIHWEEWPAAVGTALEREMRRAMNEGADVHFEHRYVSGAYDVWLEIDAYPSAQGLSLFYRDITDRKQAEEALRRSREDLRMAVDAARIGTFYCDYPLNRIIWNDTCKEHFFLPPDAEIDFTLFYSLLHPDDREPTRQAIGRALDERVEYDVAYRTLAPDGRTRWINAVGRFYYGPEGSPIRFDGITIDISERKQAERQLRGLFESQVVGIIFWNLDTGQITAANETFLSMVGYTREDLASGLLNFRTMTPPEWQERNEQGVAAIRASGSATTYEKEYIRKDGSRVPILISGTRFEESGTDGFSYILDITERKRAEEEERRAAVRSTAILESITDAFMAFDSDWRFIYVNDQSERIMARTRPELLGRIFWDEFPAAVGSTFEREYRRAVDEQVSVAFEEYYAPLNIWIDVRAYPSAGGLSVFYQDVTERVERRRREQFLAELTERGRRMTDPDEVIADTVRSIGRFLGGSRCVFADIDINADTCTIPFDYCSDETMTSMVGTFPISDFGAYLVSEYGAGHTVAVGDVRADPVRFPLENIGAYEAIACRAFIAAPVLHSTRLVSVLAVHSPTPRRWTPEEVEILQTVVERAWLTVAVLRQQRDLAREAQEQHTRAEREALLNRVGAAIRLSAEPKQVLKTAVQELGAALGADRCYYVAYDQAADTATITHDWHRAGLSDMTGQYAMSPFTVNHDPNYQAGRTQIVADTANDPAAQALGLRALLRVPLISGQTMTALAVAMADGPRLWTQADVLLVEAIATQTQTALEAVRVQHREHRIAEQLQDALQPTLPEHISGLSVGKYTNPALDEAQVGGDFYDIFPLDKELYAMVIGDVSGKGLAAAQQLALIRNSLRTTLYLYLAPAQAAAALNSIVTAHELLIGFVTAFVGVYDAVTGQIAYCSCGHEPGLIQRIGGTVEVLETTGPPLGVAENAVYTERIITLLSGDGLLLYTDGLSEAGPNRREMLGTEGLMSLLAGLPAGLTAQAQAEALVEKAHAYARGVFRDDIAVLLARRQ